MRKYIALIFLISILASLPGASYADIDDNINDYNAVIQDVTDIQTTDPNLPTGVAEPKGKVGFIISKLFNSNGRISNRVLKPIATTSRNTSNNKLLRWSGLNGGHFVDSIVYDTGTQVGIGATPTAGSLKLDVAGSIGASQYCDENGLNCFSPSSVALAGATFGGTGTAGHVTRFLGSNTIGDSVIRDNGTNVGIGTAPGANRLMVNGIARIDGGVSVDGRTAITGTNYTHTARATEDTHYGYFEVRNNSNQRGAYFGWGNGGNTVDLYIDNASLLRIRSGQVSLETEGTTATHLVTKGYVDNATSAASPWTVSGANIYRSGGNVGIGTTSPAHKLDVNGTIGMSGKGVIYGNANDVYVNARVLQNTSSTLTDGMYINYNSVNSSNNTVKFYTAGTVERMRIANNGNVGIGTSTPSSQLHTTGVARIDGGVTIDGRTSISGTNYTHTARATEDTHYGFFEVRNNSNQRGAYFGWGDGGSTVDLVLENANLLRIQSGKVSLETEGTAASHLVTKGYVDGVTGAGSMGIDDLIDGSSDGSSVFLGANSGNSDDGANSNIGVGLESLRYNTSGSQNTAIGRYALRQNTTGIRNTSLGYHSMQANTTGNYNNAIGYDALGDNISGGYNNALGYRALGANTTGTANNAIGGYALDANTTGYSNSALGYTALSANTTGYSNSAIGGYALHYNTTGVRNTGLGYGSMSANTTGSDNTAAGIYSLDANTTGYQNTAIGYDALGVVTSGHNNTALGDNAGDNITSGNYNIIIGSDVDAPSATGNNQINIGNTIYGNRATGSLITTRQGIKGNYSSSQVQGIWSIGDAYNVNTSATNDFGNQFGMVYGYTNAGTAAIGGKKPITGKGHQILFTNGGATTSMISLSYGDAIFKGDVTSATVATNCVGRGCGGTTLPPASGNWNVTGNLNVSGNLTAANFYDQTPIVGTSLKGNAVYTAAYAGRHTYNRLSRVIVTVPPGPSRKYRLAGKAMALGSNKYHLFGIFNSAGTAVTHTYEYSGGHEGWESTHIEGYVSLPPGTHTFYIQAYGDASYEKSYHTHPTYTNVTAWPLQG